MVTTEFAAGQTSQQVGEKERLAWSSGAVHQPQAGPSVRSVFLPTSCSRTSDSAAQAFTELPESPERHHPRQAITTEPCVPGLELIFRISR